jgi:hypothetical protein
MGVGSSWYASLGLCDSRFIDTSIFPLWIVLHAAPQRPKDKVAQERSGNVAGVQYLKSCKASPASRAQFSWVQRLQHRGDEEQRRRVSRESAGVELVQSVSVSASWSVFSSAQ